MHRTFEQPVVHAQSQRTRKSGWPLLPPPQHYLPVLSAKSRSSEAKTAGKYLEIRNYRVVLPEFSCIESWWYSALVKILPDNMAGAAAQRFSQYVEDIGELLNMDVPHFPIIAMDMSAYCQFTTNQKRFLPAELGIVAFDLSGKINDLYSSRIDPG